MIGAEFCDGGNPNDSPPQVTTAARGGHENMKPWTKLLPGLLRRPFRFVFTCTPNVHIHNNECPRVWCLQFHRIGSNCILNIKKNSVQKSSSILSTFCRLCYWRSLAPEHRCIPISVARQRNCWGVASTSGGNMWTFHK